MSALQRWMVAPPPQVHGQESFPASQASFFKNISRSLARNHVITPLEPMRARGTDLVSSCASLSDVHSNRNGNRIKLAETNRATLFTCCCLVLRQIPSDSAFPFGGSVQSRQGLAAATTLTSPAANAVRRPAAGRGRPRGLWSTARSSAGAVGRSPSPVRVTCVGVGARRHLPISKKEKKKKNDQLIDARFDHRWPFVVCVLCVDSSRRSKVGDELRPQLVAGKTRRLSLDRFFSTEFRGNESL